VLDKTVNCKTTACSWEHLIFISSFGVLAYMRHSVESVVPVVFP